MHFLLERLNYEILLDEEIAKILSNDKTSSEKTEILFEPYRCAVLFAITARFSETRQC